MYYHLPFYVLVGVIVDVSSMFKFCKQLFSYSYTLIRLPPFIKQVVYVTDLRIDMPIGKELSILVCQLGFILKVGTRWRVTLSEKVILLFFCTLRNWSKS